MAAVFQPAYPRRTGAKNDPRRSQAGFSVLEGLIAMAVLLIVVLGLIPLFTQSMVNNVAGRHLMQASNFATDSFEAAQGLPLGNELLDVPDGELTGLTLQALAGTDPDESSGTPTEERAYQVVKSVALDPGDEIETSPAELFNLVDISDATLAKNVEWFRLIEVDQFQVSALSDGEVSDVDTEFSDAERLPGDELDANVRFKRVRITIIPRGQDQGSFGSGRITATLVKAF